MAERLRMNVLLNIVAILQDLVCEAGTARKGRWTHRARARDFSLRCACAHWTACNGFRWSFIPRLRSSRLRKNCAKRDLAVLRVRNEGGGYGLLWASRAKAAHA
jgi:hypothetical protein